VFRLAPALVVLAAMPGAALVAQPRGSMLDRIGTYVERYYERAERLLAVETVTLQPLARDLLADGFARRLVYELRVEWDPDAPEGEPPATVVRDLVSVNGRPPRPGDEPRCHDPHPVSPEPLAALLPDRRGEYVFTAPRAGTVDGRAAMIVDYRPVRAEPPRVEWRDECATIELPGRTSGRVWADPETAEILRFDERLLGMVDIAVPFAQQRRGAARFMTIERADMSIRYEPIAFIDPDETLMLPERVDTLVVIRDSGTPRMRITQTFANYRRFVTESRIIR
jgi:hypothetical protein